MWVLGETKSGRARPAPSGPSLHPHTIMAPHLGGRVDRQKGEFQEQVTGGGKRRRWRVGGGREEEKLRKSCYGELDAVRVNFISALRILSYTTK